MHVFSSPDDDLLTRRQFKRKYFQNFLYILKKYAFFIEILLNVVFYFQL